MKRNLIAVSMALAMLLALCGCSSTGSLNDGTMSPNPSQTAGTNNGGLPNNAGGTANNGTNGDTGGTGASNAAKSGNYNAGYNGSVNAGDGSHGLLYDAGDAVRDAAHDMGRTVRDVL